MKTPNTSLPKIKIDLEKIQKVGIAAVGLGGALLVASDPKFRRRVTGEFKNFTQRLRSAAIHTAAGGLPISHDDAPSSGQSGVVYMLQSGPFYKIGKTINFAQRARQIRLSLPFPAEVIHLIQCSDISHVETYWHRRFANRRQNGEWFVLTDEEIAEFKSHTYM